MSAVSVTTTTRTLTYEDRGGISKDSTGGASKYAVHYFDNQDRLYEVLWRNSSTDALMERAIFYFDGYNRRIRTIESQYTGGSWSTISDTRYVYDGMNVVQERDGATTVKTKYTWGQSLGGGIGGLLSKTDVSGSAHYYYHYDGGGNVVQLTDASEATVATYAYDPYGNIESMGGAQASANPYRFSTKWSHPPVTTGGVTYDSGVIDFGMRFYGPSLGKWLNRDPLREEGGLNVYAFVHNNPTNRVDPHGLKEGAWSDPSTFKISNFEGGAEEACNGLLAVLAGGLGEGDLFEYLNYYNPRKYRFSYYAGFVAATALETAFGLNSAAKISAAPSEYSAFERGVVQAERAFPGKIGKLESHHILPKYLGGAKDGPEIMLPAPYHQVITNAFRKEYAYGQTKPALKEAFEIMEKVYSDHPLPW